MNRIQSMAPLSAAEIQKLAFELKTSEGHRLQEVRLCRDLIALGFYSTELYWIIVDLNPQAPQIVYLPDIRSIRFQDEKKPIQLYLKAHFIGQRLGEVSASPDLGRVIFLNFSKDMFIEIRLFPRGQNFLIHSGKTIVSYAKPKLLKEVDDVCVQDLPQASVLLPKSADWLREQTKKNKNVVISSNPVEAQIRNKEAKLNKAILKIGEDILAKEQLHWAELGEWLKAHQTLAVPVEFSDYIDKKKSFAQNLEICFRKAKETKLKIVGAKKRIQELQSELLGKNNKVSKTDVTEAPSSLKLAKAKGRTFALESGAVLFIGKSADDNLRLLRQAKPWYYWMHLRDMPSCHGLIQRNKNHVLTEAGFHLAANQLIASNFGEKQKRHVGDKFDIIVTECRFVRPIKGDRHGRVNYSDERTFTHLFQA